VDVVRGDVTGAMTVAERLRYTQDRLELVELELQDVREEKKRKQQHGGMVQASVDYLDDDRGQLTQSQRSAAKHIPAGLGPLGALTWLHLNGGTPEQLAAADTDADGLLSAQELSAATGVSVADSMAAIATADTDGDGQLSIAEMQAAAAGAAGGRGAAAEGVGADDDRVLDIAGGERRWSGKSAKVTPQ
jgi:hypothetical protein